MHPEDDNEVGRLKAKLKDSEALLKDYKIRFKNADDARCQLRADNAALKAQLSQAIIIPAIMPIEKPKEKEISWWKFWRS